METVDYDFTETAPSAFRLRGRQPEWLDTIDRDLLTKDRVLVVAPGGIGKSTIMGALAHRFHGRGIKTLVLQNRERLTEQTANRIASETGLDVDVEMADSHASPYAPVVVGSVQTMGRAPRLTGFADDHFGLTIPDECFPSSVTVGGTKINEIKIGDQIESFNHETGTIENRSVIATSSSRAGVLIEITCGSRRIVSTPNHPVFVGGGYKAASCIKSGDYLSSCALQMPRLQVSSPPIRTIQKKSNSGLQIMRKITEGRPCKGNSKSMQTLRDTRQMFWENASDDEFICRKGKPCLLQPNLQGYMGSEKQCRKNAPKINCTQQAIRICKDAGAQPNGQSGKHKKNGGRNEGKDIFISRRKRSANHSAEGALRGTGWAANGICDTNEIGSGPVPIASRLLQSGSGIPRNETCNRSGWTKPQAEEVEVLGCQKDGSLKLVRVDRVEILERGSDGRYEQVCPDGLVYNLEIEGNHNYFANGFLVHNCHFSLAPGPQRIMSYFHFGADSLAENWVRPKDGLYVPKCKIAGFTATPDLRTKRNLGEFYQHRSVNYSYLEAIDEGWLVGIREYNIPVQIDTKKFRVKRTAEGAEFQTADQSAAITPVIPELAAQIVEHASDRKTICFMPSVECARLMADQLNRRGLRAIFVSGECIDKSEKTDEFQVAGPGTVLVNCALYVYGIDFPDADCIAVFSAVLSKVNYIQKLYRGSRVLPGVVTDEMTAEERKAAIASSRKPWMLVLSPFFISDRIDICSVYDLFTDQPEVKKRMKDLDLPLEEAAKKAERDYMGALEKQAAKFAKRKSRIIDPVSWSVSLGDAKLGEFKPTETWHSLPVRDDQRTMLVNLKMDPDKYGIKNQGLADKVIGVLLLRRDLKLATIGQLEFLKKLTKEDANGIRVPMFSEERLATMKADQAGAISGRMRAKWSQPKE